MRLNYDLRTHALMRVFRYEWHYVKNAIGKPPVFLREQQIGWVITHVSHDGGHRLLAGGPVRLVP